MRLHALRFPIYFLLLIFFLPLAFLHATATMFSRWRAAYFDVLFVGNYGSDKRAERFVNDVVAKMNVVIRIDSLLKRRWHERKLENFLQWQLVDNYMKNHRVESGSFIIEGRKVYIRLTDSVAINKALKELWHIDDVVVSPSKKAGTWLFSLHIGVSGNRLSAKQLIYDFEYGRRPDSMLLWLKIVGGLHSSHHFYQHEKDGYWHTYTGLYLTMQNVLEAQRLLLEHNGLKTTIVSQYITPTIIKKYAYE